MRFAKLEVKLILSLILTQYEYDVVNGAGNVVTKIPEPSRDNLYQVPPVETVCEYRENFFFLSRNDH